MWQRKNVSVTRTLPFLFIFAGLVGSIASFALTYDKVQILQDPTYKAACNINPILSCGSIMSTEQASLFGVPNTIFGLVGFSMLLMLGVLLLAGTDLPRRIWQAAQLAAAGGVIFMHYLFFQGVYRIDAICPWCFLVWMITIPVFLHITVYNLQQSNLSLPGKLLKHVGDFVQRHHINILVTWYLVIFALLLEHFWYYWSTLIKI